MPPGAAGRLAAGDVTGAVRSETGMDSSVDRSLDSSLDTSLDTILGATPDASRSTEASSSPVVTPSPSGPPSVSSPTKASCRDRDRPSVTQCEDIRTDAEKRRVQTPPKSSESSKPSPETPVSRSIGNGDLGSGRGRLRRGVPGIVILEDWEERCVTTEVRQPTASAPPGRAAQSEETQHQVTARVQQDVSQNSPQNRPQAGAQNRCQNRTQCSPQNRSQNRSRSRTESRPRYGDNAARPGSGAGKREDTSGTGDRTLVVAAAGQDRVVIKVTDVVEVFEDSKKVEHSERVLTNTVDFGPELGPNLTQSES